MVASQRRLDDRHSFASRRLTRFDSSTRPGSYCTYAFDRRGLPEVGPCGPSSLSSDIHSSDELCPKVVFLGRVTVRVRSNTS